MIMRGRYNVRGARPCTVPNIVTNEGGKLLLELMLQGSVAVPVGGNFYVGLLDASLVPSETTVYADLVGEPTSTGGYARQAVTRDASGWPTIDTAGAMVRAVTDVVTFSAAGANYDRAVSRMFLSTSPNAVTPGILISVSAPMTPRVITPADPFAADYELYQGS